MWIITGTGRSGTSLVCQLLARAGADFGPTDRLQPADAANPRGYFEHQEVNALNISLLLGDLARPQLLLTPPETRTQRFLATAQRAMYPLPIPDRLLHRRATRQASQIETICHDYRRRFIKDPRFSRTISVWQHYCDIEGVIFCYRHPAQVAESMKKAYGAPRAIALHEWRQRLRSFLNHTDQVRIHLVDYNRLLGNDDESYEEVASLLALTDTPESHVAPVARSVLEPSLFRTRGTATHGIGKSTMRLWQQLTSLHRASKQDVGG